MLKDERQGNEHPDPHRVVHDPWTGDGFFGDGIIENDVFLKKGVQMGRYKNRGIVRVFSANYAYGIAIPVRRAFIHLKLSEAIQKDACTSFFLERGCRGLTDQEDIGNDRFPNGSDFIHDFRQFSKATIHEALRQRK